MSHNPFKSNNPFGHAAANNNVDDVAPPPGPPPSHHRGAPPGYAPPSGPPPTQHDLGSGAGYAPPPGPPPSKGGSDSGPPPGPPPTKAQAQHEWELAVPDTSLFPPPPDIFSGYDQSPSSNATERQAEAGEAWCKQYPLAPPLTLDSVARAALSQHNPRLMQPPNNFAGSLAWTGTGLWTGKTTSKSGDSCIVAYPPLYSVTSHSPLATHRPKTVYYEVLVRGDTPKAAGDIGLALGFTALPYPTFRMPGWHRGSLAVHGDDGHKYINDRWGGKDFVQAFGKNEVYGVGMTFSPAKGKIEVEVFFTRQGREVGRWNLHEESDAEQDLPVTGLEGFHDLSLAVGTFEAVTFEVVLDPARWAYKGVKD